MFSRGQIPSTGGSIGIERIFNILEKRAEKEKEILNPTFAYVGSVGKVEQGQIFKVANWLWDAKIRTEIFYEQMGSKE